MNNEDKLIKLLNELWSALAVKPKYTEFNSLYSCDGNIERLETLEKENPKLGLSDFATWAQMRESGDWKGTKGFSLLSLLATITDELVGRRLAAIVEDDETISGWQWAKYD